MSSDTRDECKVPLKILERGGSDHVLYGTQSVHQLLFHLISAGYLELCEEMPRDRDESVFGPGLEPVDGAPRGERREPEGAIPKLFPNLRNSCCQSSINWNIKREKLTGEKQKTT